MVSAGQLTVHVAKYSALELYRLFQIFAELFEIKGGLPGSYTGESITQTLRKMDPPVSPAPS